MTASDICVLAVEGLHGGLVLVRFGFAAGWLLDLVL